MTHPTHAIAWFEIPVQDLARAVAAGGQVALPRQALPPGMGFFAHITDLDGNRVGLHALD